MTRNGTELREFRLSEAINTGIQFDSIPGCIPQYYEVEACRYHGYRYFHDWQELTPTQQQVLIAQYLTNVLLESNRNDAQAKFQRQQALRAENKRRSRRK